MACSVMHHIFANVSQLNPDKTSLSPYGWVDPGEDDLTLLAHSATLHFIKKITA